MADSEAVVTEEIPVEEAQADEEVTVTGGQTLPYGTDARPGKHTRAGFTTNKGHGEGKRRRKMASESRRKNRSRR